MSAIVVGFDLHNACFKRHGGPRKHGVNKRGELCLGTTHRLVDFANEHDAHLVVAGDLVDDPGPVQPQFAARLRDELARCRGGVSLMLGNHDMTADGDHSLGIYEQENDWFKVTVCDDTRWLMGRSLFDCALGLDDAILVPFHRDIRDERVRDVPLLIGHFGVFDDSFPPWAQRSKGAWHIDRLFELMKERNIQCALLGDWHSRRTWTKNETSISLLVEDRQERATTQIVSPEGSLLALDSGEAQRLRALYGERWQAAVSSYPDLAEPARTVSKRLSARSSLLQPAMCKSKTFRGGDAEGEHSTSCSTENTLTIMQGGALNPTGFDNQGLHGYGTAALWDGERLSWQELPGPRFCVVRSDAEEKSIVDEARRLGHNLFLRRYYEGKDKPQAPEGVEAYEALPVKVERAASVCLEQVKLPQDRMQQLVSDWLESAGDDKEALGALIKEYI